MGNTIGAYTRYIINFRIIERYSRLPVELPPTNVEQWRIQRGFHGFHGTPLLKGCLRKYYAQRTTYTTLTSELRMHFNFNSSNNARVSTPVSRIRRVHGPRAHNILPQARGNHRDNERRERASELKLIHALLPLQLGMLICYQYESAFFPRLTRKTSCFAVSAARSGVTPFCGLQTQQPGLAVGRPSFATETISEGQKSKIFMGGHAPRPP